MPLFESLDFLANPAVFDAAAGVSDDGVTA